MINVSDDYDKFLDDIKKLFKFNSKFFDADFFFIPESFNDLDVDKKNTRGFKVSYHYEAGMDEPDIKIEGDIDEKKLREYLQKHNIEVDSRFKNIFNRKQIEEIDAGELSLEPESGIHTAESRVIEPYTEINDFDNSYEIILEVPGTNKDDIILNLNEVERKITFSARNNLKHYLKHIYLPFNISMEDYNLEVNNGIATLKYRKNSNQD